MELRHLRYFVAVAEELNVRRAALRLHLSQPPLTRQIHDLEEEIGVKLLNRDKRGVQLTEAGRVFLEEARGVLSQSQRAVLLARSAQRGEAGRFNVAVPPMALDRVLSDILRKFRRQFPLVQLDIREMTTTQQLQALLENRIDLGYCSFRSPETEKELVFTPVRRSAMWVALPPGHPLARQKKISLNLLANEAFIVPSRRAPVYYEWYVNLCRSAGFNPRIAQESDSGQSMLGLVSAGIGVALVPDILRPFQSAAGIELRPLGPETIHLTFHISWRRKNSSPVLKAFLEIFLKQVKAVR